MPTTMNPAGGRSSPAISPSRSSTAAFLIRSERGIPNQRACRSWAEQRRRLRRARRATLRCVHRRRVPRQRQRARAHRRGKQHRERHARRPPGRSRRRLLIEAGMRGRPNPGESANSLTVQVPTTRGPRRSFPRRSLERPSPSRFLHRRPANPVRRHGTPACLRPNRNAACADFRHRCHRSRGRIGGSDFADKTTLVQARDAGRPGRCRQPRARRTGAGWRALRSGGAANTAGFWCR